MCKIEIGIEIAQTNKRHLASIGYRANLRPFHTEQLWLLFERLSTLLLQMVHMIYVANTARQYIETIFMIFVGILMYTSLVSTFIEMPTIFILIDQMEQVINDRSKYPKSKAMYKRANQFAEKFTEIVDFLLVRVSVYLYIFPRAIISFIIYYTTDAGPNAFELSLPVWFPFDWRNPIGYLIAVALQFRFLSFSYRYLSYFLSLGIVFSSVTLAIAEDIVDDSRSICENVRINYQAQPSIHEQLSEFIDFINQKGLFRSFIQIYRISLVALFVGSIGTISLALLMIQLEFAQSNNSGDTVMLWETIFCSFWAFNFVFVSCELGQRYSNKFNEIGKVFGKIDWYLLPIEIQRILPIIMIYLQEQNEFKFFGECSCSRKQFQKVVNSGYKYFMVLHKLYK